MQHCGATRSSFSLNIDLSKVDFRSFSFPKLALNAEAVTTGIDITEFKSPLFWQLPFTHVRVGFMGNRTNNLTSWGSFAYPGSALSLWNVFAPNGYVQVQIYCILTWIEPPSSASAFSSSPD
eukprot:m.759323 g.759323  ORF g.759323 m.759323 type:complete len:122 (-) comp59043_c0_seq11:489-854(-)